MKRKLLTLGALAVLTSVNAQVVYVGNEAKFFVSKGALTYSGGDWMVNSTAEKTVENKGQITIVGDYKKGSLTNAATDGKEFVNVYTGANDYGQVKLLTSTVAGVGVTGSSDARMTMEKPAASSGYFGASYAISFPYQDNVERVMTSFGKTETDFKGNCGFGVYCADRYKMTLTKWNNDAVRHDAVPSGTKFMAGDYYNLNLREADMQTVMANIISYKGTPDGRAYSKTVKGVIRGYSESAFSDLGYNAWKTKENVYRERYQTYLGYASTNSKVYNKNVYRFGNPYTSNLDLSDFDGTTTAGAWLKIMNKGGHTIKQAYDASLIMNFSVSKRMADYDYTWDATTGSTGANERYYIAKFDGVRWTGSAEALLIRPTETFNLNFPTLNPTNLGSRILEVNVSFNDNHKTYNYRPAGQGNGTNTIAISTFEAGNFQDVMLAKDVAYNNVQTSGFYQLEVVLLKDNTVQSTPAYIVGATDYKESGANASTTDKVFVYGVKDDQVAYNSKKGFNEFNTNTYVGKPLGIGFNELEKGAAYQLKFNLFQGSIFNQVDDLSGAAFYLKDKETNKVIKIDKNTVINFTEGEDVATRFEVYWKQAPQGAVEDPAPVVEVPVAVVAETRQNIATTVYKEANQNKIRFEELSNTARVEVYNVAGRLISSSNNVPTNSDYTLRLAADAMYVVKVIYGNGEVRTLKVVNN